MGLAKEAGTVERMKSSDGQPGCVADVVKNSGRGQQLRIPFNQLSDFSGTLRDS